ncbi:MT-A70 family methyltransferase [Microbacterium sp. Cr-K29]|uniref:MT-A70 family methyltransferase n=1 Tax=Microbacterium sp. Cr-K29 TaxID=1452534 RepID=UPI0009E02985|nr:MT-A70 family methyltransferase [Microbacterium sp. Cr-K29]
MTLTFDPPRSRKKAEPLRDEQTAPPLPTVEGGYATIYADPPWQFQNRTGKVAPEHRRLDRYSTMDLEAIKALPVADVAAKNAHLYLWVPNALLPEGMDVMKAWGFRYVSNIIWAKRRKDGGPDGRGVGFYFRNVTEILLFGVRGSMRTLAPARSQVNMVETRKREHSRKPDEFYPLIEACSPGPRLEMFARRAQPGWDVFGDESDEEIEPRGREQRGYSGGEIERTWQPNDLPALAPHERLATDMADEVAKLIRAFYDSGQSIRDIAATTGYSIQRVRTLLQSAGADLRPRGGS